MENRITIRDPAAVKTSVAEIAVLWDRFAEITESDLSVIAEAEPWLTEAGIALNRKKEALFADIDAAEQIEDADSRRNVLNALRKALDELQRQIAAVMRMGEQYRTLKADAQRLIRDSNTLRDNEKQLAAKVVAAMNYMIDSK